MRLLRVQIGLAILVVAVGLLTTIVMLHASPDETFVRIVAVVTGAAAILSGLGLAMLGHRLESRLDQLRGWVHLVAGQLDTSGRAIAPGIDSVDKLQLAIIDMLGIRMDQQNAIYRRLEDVLSVLPDGVVAVTPEGLVSLVNAAGRPLFGEEGNVVGKSLFDTITPASFNAAITQAQLSEKPITVALETMWGESLEATIALIGSDGSALIRYAAATAASMGLQHDLTLHDRIIAPTDVTNDTALNALPLLSIDTETTGLDIQRDRIISIGAVHLQEGRLLRSGPLNLLFNPGRPIPSRTVAVHGISNSMVASAPPFASAADHIAANTEGMVLVGHRIDFDIAMLRSEMLRCNRNWTPKGALDVMLLYAGLFPDRHALSLDAMAEELEVSVVGRHSALGDALTTGEVFLRLLPLLSEAGVSTFGGADLLQRKASARLGPGSAVIGQGQS